MSKKKKLELNFENMGMAVVMPNGDSLGQIKKAYDLPDNGYVFEDDSGMLFTTEELEAIVAKLKELNK